MYRRYLPTLTLKKQQLQAEIRTIEAKAEAVRKERENLEKGFSSWIAVFSETDAFPEGIKATLEQFIDSKPVDLDNLPNQLDLFDVSDM